MITDEDLETTRDTLEKMQASLAKYEPYATIEIQAIVTVMDNMSVQAEDYPEP